MAELGSWQTVEPRGRAPYHWASLPLCPAPVPTAASSLVPCHPSPDGRAAKSLLRSMSGFLADEAQNLATVDVRETGAVHGVLERSPRSVK